MSPSERVGVEERARSRIRDLVTGRAESASANGFSLKPAGPLETAEQAQKARAKRLT